MRRSSLLGLVFASVIASLAARASANDEAGPEQPQRAPPQTAPSDDDWLAPLPSTVAAPRALPPRANARAKRGALTAPERERTVLLGAGVGACFVGGRWSSAGPCAKIDASFLIAFKGGALALGVEIGYERYSSITEPGLAPTGPTVADVSGLTVGIPIAARFSEPGAAFAPYIGAATLIVVQSSRYVLPQNQIVDTSAERIAIRPFFGAEVPVGPGAAYGEFGYRASFAIERSSPQVKHDGAQIVAGYRIRF